MKQQRFRSPSADHEGRPSDVAIRCIALQTVANGSGGRICDVRGGHFRASKCAGEVKSVYSSSIRCGFLRRLGITRPPCKQHHEFDLLLVREGRPESGRGKPAADNGRTDCRSINGTQSARRALRPCPVSISARRRNRRRAGRPARSRGSWRSNPVQNGSRAACRRAESRTRS